MKIAHTILASSLLLVGCDKPAYEFHSGGDGQLIWRCNRLTGEITAVRTNLIYAPQSTPSPIAAYELHNSTDTTPILFNKLTGQTWRFFRNHNAKGAATLEGFILLDKFGAAVEPEPAIESSPNQISPEEFLKSTIPVPGWAQTTPYTNSPTK